MGSFLSWENEDMMTLTLGERDIHTESSTPKMARNKDIPCEIGNNEPHIRKIQVTIYLININSSVV